MFAFGQNFQLTLVQFVSFWANFHCCKWPNIENTIWSQMSYRIDPCIGKLPQSMLDLTLFFSFSNLVEIIHLFRVLVFT